MTRRRCSFHTVHGGGRDGFWSCAAQPSPDPLTRADAFPDSRAHFKAPSKSMLAAVLRMCFAAG